jgi:hypothetical protein
VKYVAGYMPELSRGKPRFSREDLNRRYDIIVQVHDPYVVRFWLRSHWAPVLNPL